MPRWGPELINWALSDEYHNQPGGHIRIYRQGVLEQRIKDAGLTVTGSAHTHGLHSPYWWLKCAVGVQNDAHPLVKAYHQLLMWDITDRPAADCASPKPSLAPIMGKSLVIYAKKA